MSDRELLELAARAAGIDWFDEPAAKQGKGLHMKHGPFWNPLADDGDALRLAVKLDIEIEPVPFGGRAIVRDDDDYGEQFDEESPDRMAATRRAIVRAAAEIAQRTTAREGK